MKRLLLVGVMVALGWSVTAEAGTDPSIETILRHEKADQPNVGQKHLVKPKVPRVIRAGTNSGKFKIIDEFPIGQNLTGWAIKGGDGGHLLLFSTKDGYVLSGQLVAPSGKPMETELKQEYFGDSVRKGIAHSHDVSIAEGTGPIRLNVFFDPNCEYCHRLWEGLRGLLDQVTVIWHPVVLFRGSMQKIAWLMAQPDRRRALAEMEEGRGGVAHPTQWMVDGVKQNMNRMDAMNLTATPSGTVQAPNGAPQEFSGDGILAQIEGVAHQ